MTKALGGIMGPVVTTFDEATGDLAAVPFRANIRAHVNAGLTGIIVAGSTGEAALLEEHERHRLLEWARPIVPDERWLIAGVGGESTRVTVRRAREAAERGADAVLVVAPHYYGAQMTPEALAAHFRRVADESPLPLVLYNIPKYVHFPLAPGLVHELAGHDNVIGIKDSSGDLESVGRISQRPVRPIHGVDRKRRRSVRGAGDGSPRRRARRGPVRGGAVGVAVPSLREWRYGVGRARTGAADAAGAHDRGRARRGWGQGGDGSRGAGRRPRASPAAPAPRSGAATGWPSSFATRGWRARHNEWPPAASTRRPRGGISRC